MTTIAIFENQTPMKALEHNSEKKRLQASALKFPKSVTDITLISFDDLENREVDSIKIAMAKYQTHFKYLFDRYCAMSSDRISLSH